MTEYEKVDLADRLRDLHGTECEFLIVVESLSDEIFDRLPGHEVDALAVEIHDIVVDGD